MSNDLTEPQGGEKYDTTPGVTAILERINHVHTDLVERINGVSTEMRQNDSALLERINQVHSSLSERIDHVHTEMRQSESAILDLIGEVRTELLEEIKQNNSTMMIRFNDIEGQVRLTNAKLDVDREDLFNTKVQVRDVRARVEELERKRS